MSQTFTQLLEIADEIENFPLGNCGPSDDPDMQTAYLYAFRDLAKRFVATANRVRDQGLSDLIAGLDTSPEFITDAYDLRADMFCAIDYLRSAANNFDSEVLPYEFAQCFVGIWEVKSTLATHSLWNVALDVK